MKKIILLFTFAALGYLASDAQTVEAKSRGTHPATIAAPQGTPSVAKSDSKDAVDSKKENCSPAEKKNCEKNSGGKSCCSKKGEVKK